MNSPQGSVPITASEPAIAVEVAADKDVYAEGETITYTYTVSNTGDRDLGNITIPKGSFDGTGTYPDEVTCTPDTLPAGSTDTATCTVEYVATAEDVARGSIHNTASASSDVVDSEGAVVGTEKVLSDPAATKGTAAEPALRVTSDLDDKLFEEGKPLNYTYTVTNDGNVPLTDVGVAKNSFNGDNTTSFPDNVTCTPTDLAPGEQATCQASYTPTAADVERGSITAVASAVGTPPAGGTVKSPTTTEIAEVSDPELTIEVSTDAEMFVAGEPVEYTYTIKNTGNEKVNGVSVGTDSFTGDGTWGELSCSPTDLDPGAEATCTRSYTPTTADETRGTVSNAVHATGALGSGTKVASQPKSKSITAEKPELTLAVSVDKDTFTGAPETITYTYEVTNTGNVPIDEIAIENTSFSGNGTPPNVTCAETSLAVGASTTCTASYDTVQADLDQGSVNNIATATGQRVGSDTKVVSKPDNAYADADNQALTITEVTAPEKFQAGETIEITYLVKNDGTDPVDDPKLVTESATGGNPATTTTCTPDSLGIGEVATCAVSYTTTVDDVKRGSIVTSGHAAGTVEGKPVASEPKTTDIPAVKPSLAIDAVIKQSDFVAGEALDFEFVVTNTGNVDMTNIAVDPASFSGDTFPEVTCPTGTLAPAASVTCSASYTTTDADAEAGHVSMVVAAKGTSVGGTPVESATDPAAISADDRKSELVVEVTPDRDSFVAGEEITYNYEITNTGTTTLENVGVDNATFTGSGTAPTPTNCTPTTLAPGEKATCSATYTPTAEDVTNETIDYVANADATIQDAPSRSVVSLPDSVSTTLAKPKLNLTTISAPKDKFIAGQEVNYTYEIENTGDKPIENIVVISDSFTGSGTPSAVTCDPLPDGGLPVGAKLTCTQSYTTTHADAARGSIINHVHAHGNVPGTTDNVETDPVTNKVVAAEPELTLSVTADKESFVVAEPVRFEYTVTNTGDVKVDDVKISPDTFTGTNGFPSDVTCSPSSLAPDEQAKCVAIYTPTEADFGAKTIGNTVHATGALTPPGGGDSVAIDSQQASINTPASQPKLAIMASVDSANFVEGSELDYTFKVTNPGDREIDDLTIELPEGFTDPICTPTSLKPGDPAATCTASYTATAADVSAGVIEVPATAVGEVVGTDTPVLSAPSTLETPVAAPELTVIGKADKDTFVAGEDVTYTYVVTNTGDVSVDEVTISEDSFTGSAGLPSDVTCTPAELEPRAQAICSFSYTATEADEAAATIDSQVVASAKVADTESPVASDPIAIEVAAAEPKLDISGGPDRSKFVAGSEITYTYEVSNPGDKPIEDILITPDGLPDGLSFTCAPTSLPANSTDVAVCTATHVATQEDVESGLIAGEVTAAGKVVGTDRAVTTEELPVSVAAFNPELSLAVTVDKAQAVQGEVLNYTYEVTNTGKDTVEGLSFDTSNFTGAEPLAEASCAATTLVPGATTTCTASYTVAGPDVFTSSITNSVEATGTAINPDEPGRSIPVNSNQHSVETDVLEPGLKITPSIETETFEEGEEITFKFEVENTGEVPLTDISADLDEFTGSGDVPEIVCPTTELAVGEKTVCEAKYIPTAEDVERGNIVAVASVEGSTETTPPVTAESDPATVVAKNTEPFLEIEATAGSVTFNEGETVGYTFVVTNTSDTATVTDLDVLPVAFNGEDPFPSDVSCAPEALEPGSQAICSASYTPTAADAGKPTLSASVIASGLLEKTDPGDPDQEVNSLPDDVAVEVERPSLKLSSELPVTEFRVGEEVTFTYQVTNTGNVPLVDITVDPVQSNLSGVTSNAVCSPDEVSLDGTTTCTITYVPTEADAARGEIELTAQATGRNRFCDDTGRSNTTTESASASEAGLSTEIKVNKPSFEAGDELVYTVEVENTGGVPLSDIEVSIDSFSGSGEPPVLNCDPADQPVRLLPNGTLATNTGSPERLGVDEVMTCTATYTATPEDELNQQLTISTITTATPSTGTLEPVTAELTTPATPDPGAVWDLDISIEPHEDQPELLELEDDHSHIVYHVTVENTGTESAYNVSIEDLFPAGYNYSDENPSGEVTITTSQGDRTVTYQGAADGAASFLLDAIDPGEQVSFDIVYEIDISEAIESDFTNRISVTEITKDPGGKVPGPDLPNATDSAVASPPYGLGHLVYRDENKNNTYDEQVDSALSGVEIILLTDEDGDLKPDDRNRDNKLDYGDAVDSAITDSEGHYYFADVPSGFYFIAAAQNNFSDDGPLCDHDYIGKTTYKKAAGTEPQPTEPPAEGEDPGDEPVVEAPESLPVAPRILRVGAAPEQDTGIVQPKLRALAPVQSRPVGAPSVPQQVDQYLGDLAQATGAATFAATTPEPIWEVMTNRIDLHGMQPLGEPGAALIDERIEDRFSNMTFNFGFHLNPPDQPGTGNQLPVRLPNTGK